jgi:hypothetical protein
VPRRDLIGDDVEAFRDDAADIAGGKEPILRAQHVRGRHLRPPLQRPARVVGRRGLGPLVAQSAFAESPRHVVVVEDVWVGVTGEASIDRCLLPHRPTVARVGPEVVGSLTGRRNHRRHEDQPIDWHPRRDERRGESAVRMAHHHELLPLADGFDHRLGVVL